MKKIRQFIPVFTLVFALTATIISVYMLSTKPKTAYVDLTKLYDGFDLKKKLEQQLTTVQQFRQQQLDSLELGLKVLSKNIQAMDPEKQKTDYETKTKEFTTDREEYLLKQKSFTEDNSTLSDQYTAQIWKQLNQYVKDYGDAHNYTYIMGGDGTGTMMYANTTEDLTETLVTYTNDRYKGETVK